MTTRPRLFRLLFYSLLALLLLALIVVAVIYVLLRASVATESGMVKLSGLGATTIVQRDDRGSVSLAAATTQDAMRTLGFVHAQERFFEMDLARRAAAGELSALLGKATIEMDRKKRVHRFRSRVKDIVAGLSDEERTTFKAYAEGANAGLAQLASRPWQYWLLNTNPVPWQEEDSILVMCEMFYMLQAKSFEDDLSTRRLAEVLPAPLVAWLRPVGGSWDAALDGSMTPEVPMPGPDLLNVKAVAPPHKPINNILALDGGVREDAMVGSNAWALGGARTLHGGGMLADDMHLGHGVPNIWFRASIDIKTPPPIGIDPAGKQMNEAPKGLYAVGVTLPGVPALVVGSNRHIAWGFTNSYGKWFEWNQVSAQDLKAAKRFKEKIEVKGGEAIDMDVLETAAGPIVETFKDKEGERAYAMRWLAHEREAINVRLSQLMFAKNVDEAVAVAQTSGLPHQNFHVVDTAGNVAWTIAGRMHKRDKVAGDGVTWLQPSEYPIVKNPADGRIWTANNRQLGGAAGELIGNGGPDIGARAQQIRDRLREKEKFAETDLHAIQLDNEGRFMKRWVMLAAAVAENAKTPSAKSAQAFLDKWNGRADVDQVGYRIARSFRLKTFDSLWGAWLHAAAPTLHGSVPWEGRFEYAGWQALSDKPAHLLPKPFATWDAFLEAQLAATVDELVKIEGRLENATWGKRNTAKIRHPFSRVIPALSAYLDMPATPLPGDNHMPRVAAPAFGQSQRMVVSPGREHQGILSMPGGQSGHPLSPYFASGHRAWAEGMVTPLAAGKARSTLVMSPR
jgi:penicillin G amidase